MKLVLTGGAGFIGSHIAEAYLQEGLEVVVVDDLSHGKKENIPQGAKFYQLDICEQEALEEIFEKEQPELVNHHSAQIDVRRSVAEPVFDARVNILGSLNLLELSRKYQVKKFIFASTGGALYGEQKEFPATEDHPIRPVSPYGVAKASVELYLYYYHQVHGLEYVSLRYSNVYGPRQDPFGEAGVVAIFCQKLLSGETPIINGSGEQTRDFVYVKDVVRANILALKPGLVGAFNISTSKETTINQLYQILVRLAEKNLKPRYAPPKPGEQFRSCLDNSQANQKLGWKPEVKLEEGLKLTLEYFSQKLCS